MDCSKVQLKSGVKPEDKSVEEDPCGICGEDYTNMIKCTLKCKHYFHYDCLIGTFKYSGKYLNSCPYCRQKCGLLDLPEGRTPIKNINKMPNVELVKYICEAKLKSGPRKNLDCGCAVVPSYTFCKRHLKLNL
jgi:hypothetical protein